MIGCKYRIYPTDAQKVFLEQQFGCCRFVYNQLLAQSIENYKRDKTSKPLSNYAWLKDSYEWLKDADSLGLAYAGQNLKQAYLNFFRTKKGFPKFHSKHASKLSYKTNCQIKDGKLKVPKLKSTIRVIFHRELPDAPKNVVISRTKDGRYYASFLLEYEPPKLPKTDKVVGIDIGVKTLAVCSDGKVFKNPKTLHKWERKLKTAHKDISRKVKGSHRRKLACQRLAKIHGKVRDIQNNYLHNVSRQIINENQVICLEDLNVVGMLKNHKLAKSVQDAQFGKLVDMIEYKAKMYGREVRKVDRFFPSSQICSVCGTKNPETKNLSIRKWVCPQCGTEHDRDYNASLNILAEASSVSGRGARAARFYYEATSPSLQGRVL